MLLRIVEGDLIDLHPALAHVQGHSTSETIQLLMKCGCCSFIWQLCFLHGKSIGWHRTERADYGRVMIQHQTSFGNCLVYGRETEDLALRFEKTSRSSRSCFPADFLPALSDSFSFLPDLIMEAIDQCCPCSLGSPMTHPHSIGYRL